MTTPTSTFKSGLIDAKIGTLAKQTIAATDLIYGMHKLDFRNNIGGFSLGYTSSH